MNTQHAGEGAKAHYNRPTSKAVNTTGSNKLWRARTVNVNGTGTLGATHIPRGRGVAGHGCQNCGEGAGTPMNWHESLQWFLCGQCSTAFSRAIRALDAQASRERELSAAEILNAPYV